jgi:hypothetical protein
MRIYMVALLLAVSACVATEPRRVSETPPTVSYSFTGDQLDDARDKAQNYCDNYNMDAELLDVDRGATQNIAHFECR